MNTDNEHEPVSLADIEELEEFITDEDLYGADDDVPPQMALHTDVSDLIPREQQTRRGRRVSLELMNEVRAMLEQLTDSGRMKISAVALSYGTGVSETSAIWMMERIHKLRIEQGWTDPDFLRALQEPRKDVA